MSYVFHLQYVVTFIAALLMNVQLGSALGAQVFPCFFIFGDSTVDNGNNNQLKTEARANYFPYGIDFPQGPTGRFTNGRNIADIIAQRLGFNTYIPPFATSQDNEDILNGLNYGSGSAGIRNETGQHLGDRVFLDKQLQNHNLTISRISKILGDDALAKQHLGKCLYNVVIGINDYVNNYYVPQSYSTSSIYTTNEYANVLVQQYSQQLKTLYTHGARKITVFGVAAVIGCIPDIVPGSTTCIQSRNDAVKLFNSALKLLVNDLNRNLSDAQFIYTNAFNIVPSRLLALGIGTTFASPCCKVSNTTGQCIPGETPCPFRIFHGIYDNFHPTEVVNKLLATAALVDIIKLIY